MSGTILIVDAVATNRLSLRMRLNKARYTVQAVHSIQEALLSQQAGSWDAVFLSVETPKDIFSLRNKKARSAVKKGIAARQSKVMAADVFVIE